MIAYEQLSTAAVSSYSRYCGCLYRVLFLLAKIILVILKTYDSLRILRNLSHLGGFAFNCGSLLSHWILILYFKCNCYTSLSLFCLTSNKMIFKIISIKNYISNPILPVSQPTLEKFIILLRCDIYTSMGKN